MRRIAVGRDIAVYALIIEVVDRSKQDWRRDPSTWRRAFLLTRLTPKLDGVSNPQATAPLHEKWHEVADTFEQHFNKLPEWKQVVRGKGLKFYSS